METQAGEVNPTERIRCQLEGVGDYPYKPDRTPIDPVPGPVPGPHSGTGTGT